MLCYVMLCYVMLCYVMLYSFLFCSVLFCCVILSYLIAIVSRRVASQFFSGKPRNDFAGPFCLSCTFIFRNERNWMKKSARVLEKTGKPGLTWLTGSYAPGVVSCRVVSYRRIESYLIVSYIVSYFILFYLIFLISSQEDELK